MRINQIHLEKDPVVGIDEKNDPIMLQAPRAIISWLASKGFPPAVGKGLIWCCWLNVGSLTESLCNGDGLEDGDDRNDDEGAAQVANHVTEGDVLGRQRSILDAVLWDGEGGQAGRWDASSDLSGERESAIVPGEFLVLLRSKSKPSSHLSASHTLMSGVINIATIAMVTTTRAFLRRDIKSN